MNRFCTACGKPLDEKMEFCGACGKPVRKAGATPIVDGSSGGAATPPATPAAASPSPPSSRSAATPRPLAPEPPESVFASQTPGGGEAASSGVIPPTPDPAYFEDRGEGSGSGKYWIGGGIIFLLLFAGLYYWLFLADDIGRSEGGRPTAGVSAPAEEKVEAKLYYVTSSANIRDRAATDDSEVTGKLKRGDEARGKLVEGDAWLELEDGQGFVFVANLSQNEMPTLTQDFGRKTIRLGSSAELQAAPTDGAKILDRLSKGLTINIAGVTANDYLEVILRKGGVGYIANGAKQLKDSQPPKDPPKTIEPEVPEEPDTVDIPVIPPTNSTQPVEKQSDSDSSG
ncbi:MAG: hypothetical protein V3V15_10335 [Sphingorhabdus sp.]